MEKELKELEYLGIQVFGNIESYERWLNLFSIPLETKPILLLDNLKGIQEVNDELYRIIYGITV